MSINGNENIIIDGNDNDIKIIKEEKPKLILEDINERFRNYVVDYFCGAVTICMTILAAGFGGLGFYALVIPVLVAFFYLVYFPKEYPFMYIYVYNDRFKYFINKEVLYSDIKNFRYRNNGFYWRLKGPKERCLTLHSNQNSFYMFDCLERYSISTNSKLY